MALVLCTGIDVPLMETRKLILEQAGHTVVTATSEPEIVEACGKHIFDVAVIGQTISRRMKRVVASLVRENCPSAKILELYPLHQGRGVEDADAWLLVPSEVPHELAARVNQLAHKGNSGGRK